MAPINAQFSRKRRPVNVAARVRGGLIGMRNVQKCCARGGAKLGQVARWNLLRFAVKDDLAAARYDLQVCFAECFLGAVGQPSARVVVGNGKKLKFIFRPQFSR